jgi:hypothetical protein
VGPYSWCACADGLFTWHVASQQEHPAEEKYRRVRVTNAKFYAAVGRHLAALDFLRALGFEELNGNLELKRNDPGLLWLGKSTLQQ